jgi:hypothetical protein
MVHGQMSDWVADAVLSREDPRRRAAVIKHFVAVAEVRRCLLQSQACAD